MPFPLKVFLMLIVAFISCNQTQSPTSDHEKGLASQEAMEPQRDSLGTLISTIEFKLKATKDELEIFEDGIVPWISLENPDSEIPRLIDADQIVLPHKEAILFIDYPLNKPATFKLASTEKGFTRKQLIQEISRKYHFVYQEEERSTSIQTVPVEKRKELLNRNETNGKYGIWGHDLSDLDLSGVEVYRNTQGKIFLVLSVES